jgi:DNA-binding transcriptional LysR family regulator
MNRTPALQDLTAFATIATHGSFRKAADELGVSPSTLSHMMRTMEATLGARLLHRTTRSVATTEAGARLLQRLQPLLRDLDAALQDVAPSGPPSGTVRINSSNVAARAMLQDCLPDFLARHPEINVDLVTEGRLVDIVAEGFDAGIRLAESVPADMIAVPLGPQARFVVVAAPAYLAAHPNGIPDTPQALMQYDCIRFRMPSGKRYRWEFSRHGTAIALDVPGALTLDDPELMVLAACAGLGLAYVSIQSAAAAVARGELVTLLDAWCPWIPGLCLYYPGHRHVPPALRALIDTLQSQRADTAAKGIRHSAMPDVPH